MTNLDITMADSAATNDTEITNTNGTVNSKSNREILPLHVIRNTTSNGEKELGSRHYHCVADARDILNLKNVMNLREYFAEYNVKRRTGVHKDIRDTLDLEHRRFCQRNQGIMLLVSKANMDTDKGIATLVDCSIGNGAQTQGELRKYFDELDAQVKQQDEIDRDKESEDEPGKKHVVEVQVEIIEESDINERRETAIARNNTNSVESLSIAGYRDQLNELDDVMVAAGFSGGIQKSETDRTSAEKDAIQTRLLIQITRLLIDGETLYPEAKIPERYMVDSYSGAAKCLDDFTRSQKESNKDSNAKAKYEAYLELAPQAWQLYKDLCKHDDWNGLKLQKVYKTSGKTLVTRKNDKVVNVNNGMLFPIIYSLGSFVSKDSDGKHVLKIPSDFNYKALFADAYDIFPDHNYDPAMYGRAKSTYTQLYGRNEVIAEKSKMAAKKAEFEAEYEALKKENAKLKAQLTK